MYITISCYSRPRSNGLAEVCKCVIKWGTLKDPVLSLKKPNVVYCIPCAMCPAVYVGQTSRPLETRLKEHKDAVKHAKTEMLFFLFFTCPFYTCLVQCCPDCCCLGCLYQCSTLPLLYRVSSHHYVIIHFLCSLGYLGMYLYTYYCFNHAFVLFPGYLGMSLSVSLCLCLVVFPVADV